MNYRDFLREKVFRPNVENMEVLEIGPLIGLQSNEILSCNPKQHTTVDPHFKPTFKGTLNDYINSGECQSFDVVICMGVLYHLHSPLHMIEQIINHCRPKTLIIETTVNNYGVEEEPIGLHGMAAADKGIQYPISMRMGTSRADITKAIETTPMKLDKYWEYWPNGPNWPDGYMEEFEDDEHPDWVKGKHGMFVGVYKWVE